LSTTRTDRRRKITDRYPSLLAATYAKKVLPLVGAEKERAYQFHQNLRDMAEAIIKYLVIIVLAQYRKDTSTSGKEHPNVERGLQELRQPSLGHWVDLLHKTLNLYSDSSDRLLQKLYTFYYEKKHQDNAVSTAVEKIQDWLKLKARIKPPFSYRDFFELLRPYRNQPEAWGAHGAALSDGEYKERIDVLYPAFERALLDLEFLADYSLVYVHEVRKQIDRTWSHRLSLGIGQNIVPNPDPLITQDALEPEHLYLFQDTAESGFAPLLDLYPLMTCENCQACRDSAIFVLNLGKEQHLEYLSYSCGHRLEQAPQHNQYFKMFLDVESWRNNARGSSPPSPLDLYRNVLEKALRSNRIDDFEVAQIRTLAKYLDLSPETITQLETEIRNKLAEQETGPVTPPVDDLPVVESTDKPPDLVDATPQAPPSAENLPITESHREAKLVLCWNEPIPFPATQVTLFGTPVQVLVADGKDNIYIYRENRQMLYKNHIKGPVFRVAVLDDNVLVGTWSGQLYCFGRRELLWQTNLKNPISALAVSQGEVEVVAGTWDGQVVALRSNHDILWEKRLDDGVSALSIDREGKVVAVGSYGGQLVLLDLQGDSLWVRDMQSAVVAAVFTDQTQDVIVATQDHIVTRINLHNQEILWERSVHGLPQDILLSNNNHRLIIPCREGKVLVYNLDAGMELRNEYTFADLAQVYLSPISQDGYFMLGLSRSEGLWFIDNRLGESTLENDGPLTCAAVSPQEGQYILLGDSKGISLYRSARPHLKVELKAVGELRQEHYTRLHITLQNTGERIASEIAMKLEGAIDSRPMNLPEQLEAGKTVSSENQSIRPQASGALPITIHLSYTDDSGIRYKQVIMETLDVVH
jgi:PQQ-like domain